MDTTTLFGGEIQTELATRPNMELRNRPIRMEEYTKERDDLMTPSTLTAAYLCPNAGADLMDIDPFTAELTTIVDTMKEALAKEARILEGTEVPEYGKGDWEMLHVPFASEVAMTQNELSQSETKEDQWMTGSPNGFSRIDRTHTSTPVSSTSSSTARPNSPVSGTPDSGKKSSLPLIAFCLATSAVSGCETDAMNECSECTVPMISELTLGTPSEVK